MTSVLAQPGSVDSTTSTSVIASPPPISASTSSSSSISTPLFPYSKKFKTVFGFSSFSPSSIGRSNNSSSQTVKFSTHKGRHSVDIFGGSATGENPTTTSTSLRTSIQLSAHKRKGSRDFTGGVQTKKDSSKRRSVSAIIDGSLFDPTVRAKSSNVELKIPSQSVPTSPLPPLTPINSNSNVILESGSPSSTNTHTSHIDTHKSRASLFRPGIKTFTNSNIDNSIDENMAQTHQQDEERLARRKLVRIEAQDGPWSVSVAENLDRKGEYSIYVKTPTHNLTLTRTASEIIDLHRKLASSYPDISLPTLPIDESTFESESRSGRSHSNNKKQKSSFLSTLSRLASPGPSRRERPKDKDTKPGNVTPGRTSAVNNESFVSSVLPTPKPSPGRESADPFVVTPSLDISTSSLVGAAESITAVLDKNNNIKSVQKENANNALNSPMTPTTPSPITLLAAYLTKLSNEPEVKKSKMWKRFVRVRTDDLESERVERAVKRVRSDLGRVGSRGGINGAAHAAKPEMRHGSFTFEEKAADDIALSVVEVANNTGTRLTDDEKLSSSLVLKEKIPEENEAENELCVIPNGDEVSHENEVQLESERARRSGTATPVEGMPVGISREEAAILAKFEIGEVTREAILPTPIPSPISNAHIATRIPRSQSADPDKATRMSRLFMENSASPGRERTDEESEDLVESESETPADMYGETEDVEDTEDNGETSASLLDDSSSLSSAVKEEKRRLIAQRTKKIKVKTKKSARKVVIDDFEMMRVLGKGCAGKVLLVRHKRSGGLYALKAITKRHVLAHQELLHTLTEQAVLKRMTKEGKDPFVVQLWRSFHDKENLFLVMDFHPGGDLATQLARWGRLGRDRARFYAAEIVEGVDGLHAAGVIYRDLKPENILIGADGHIVLTDFGLSKEFPRRSNAITAPATPSGTRGEFLSENGAGGQPGLPYWMTGDGLDGWPSQSLGPPDMTSTFCGTAEYLAPEVIQGLPYSYEVDWWSFGTMLYEMLTGITPFWANNHSDMYVRVLQDELKFPDDRAMDQDTKSLIRGLLQRNPALRIKQPRIKRHPYFSMIDWSHVYYKRYIPPYIPPIDPSNASDTQNFDDAFLDMEPIIDDDHEPVDSTGERTDTDRTDGEESTTPAESRSPSAHPQEVEDEADLFDGYSYKGRNSVLIDDEEADEEEDEHDDVEGDSIIGIEESVTEIESNPPTPVNPPIDLYDETPEPKTPEQRKSTVLEEDTPEAIRPAPAQEIPTEITDEQESTINSMTHSATPVDVNLNQNVIEDANVVETPATVPAKAVEPTPAANAVHPVVASRPNGQTRAPRGRREKSGVSALDKHYAQSTDDKEGMERDKEDDDWDFVEATPGFEDRNGTKGTSLFARGVVDRYRLAVFRKASTPSVRNNNRNFSGTSYDSDANAAEQQLHGSPNNTPEKRRGRNPALTFRRNPKQFLRPRTPPSSFSHHSIPTGSTRISGSTASSSGLLTPSPSTGAGVGHSLKSKESVTSVGSPPSTSSDQSINGDSLTQSAMDMTSSSKSVAPQTPESGKRPSTTGVDDTEKSKGKKLKKGAEKVFNLFASPRQ